MRSLTATAQFARDHGAPLAHALGFRSSRTPCTATLSNVLRQLDVGTVEAALKRWIAARCPDLGDQLCLDGKTLRVTRNGSIPGVHLLAAYAPHVAAVVAQIRFDGNAPAADRLKTLSYEQLLSDAELLEGGKLTYAALILLGSRKALGKFLAQAEVVWEYRSTEASGPAQDRSEYREGFFGFYEKLWDAVNARNDKQSYQDGLYVLTIPTFNERAVREAILNAVSHRDYQLGGNVFVRQFPRRLEIDSPGGFPVGITVENVIDRQNPRNRRIADAFTKCGLVERSGQGMNLMFEESIRESKPLPDFARTDQYQVGLTLHGTMQNPNLIRFLEQVGSQTTARFTTRDWLILDLVTRNEKIPKEFDGRLKHLLELGIVERTGGRRCILGQKYHNFAGQAPAYTRQKGLSREQNLTLLLNHITENATQGSPLQDLTQVLPSLSEDSIQSLLRTLKQRGQAHAVGKTKAGRWFPGTAPRATPPAGG
jgi:ATP-dependent DNA helicase RecG